MILPFFFIMCFCTILFLLLAYYCTFIRYRVFVTDGRPYSKNCATHICWHTAAKTTFHAGITSLHAPIHTGLQVAYSRCVPVSLARRMLCNIRYLMYNWTTRFRVYDLKITRFIMCDCSVRSDSSECERRLSVRWTVRPTGMDFERRIAVSEWRMCAWLYSRGEGKQLSWWWYWCYNTGMCERGRGGEVGRERENNHRMREWERQSK